jgi:O-antigen/teichoic acid export membrane protein
MRRRVVNVLRSGGVLLIVDQAVISFGNLAATIMLAKSLSAEDFGAYSLLFTSLLIVTGIANGVVSEPVRMFGVNLEANSRNRYANSQVILRVATSIPVATVALLAGLGIGGGDRSVPFAFAVLCVSTLFQELARSFSAAERQWKRILLIDAITTFAKLLGIFALSIADSLTLMRALLVMAVACVLGALHRPLGGAVLELPPAATVAKYWRQNWRYGKWLALESIVYTFSTQIYVFIVATFVGLKAVAGLAAAQSIVNLMNLLLIPLTTHISANSRYALMNHGYQSWRAYLLKAGLMVFCLAVVLCALLVFFAAPLMTVLYTPVIAEHSHLVGLLAAGAVLTVVNSILNVAFRTAEMPKAGLAAKTASAVLTNILAVPLVMRFDALGAAIGSVLTQVCWAVVFGRRIFFDKALSEDNIRRAVNVNRK